MKSQVAMPDGSVIQGVAVVSKSGIALPTLGTDGFGRLQISQANSSFDGQQEYGLDTLRLWDASANGTIAAGAANGSAVSGGNAVGPRNANTMLTPVTVSAVNGQFAVLQSRQYVRYIPGKSHLVYMTGVFAPAANSSAAIVRRSSTSGAAVDEVVAQADWNFDKFDGTGPSGITLDLTKAQIMVIDAQWLGEGAVAFGFNIDRELYWAHVFKTANVLSVPYTQTFNLPVRMEGRTAAGVSKFNSGYFDSANGIFLQTVSPTPGGTIQFNCVSVQSEGGEESRGFSMSVSNGVTPIGVTTRRPILSIRPKATYGGRTNRAHIEEIEYLIRAATNDAFIEIVVGGTLTGASFAAVDANSVAEFDTAATAISGGTSIAKGFAVSGAGAAAIVTNRALDIRSPLVLSQIDAALISQVPVSIVATAFTGTSNLSAVMNWQEQTV